VEVLNEGFDIFLAVAERGNIDAEDVEPVEKVFTEPPAFDLAGEIAVGGGDDADVDAYGLGPADALEGAFLNNTKELGLGLKGEFGDFVEEERATIGEFELAKAAAIGPGEGAAFVPEEFGFDERFGKGGAVDGDEGLRGSVRDGVNRAGDKFLAGAGFAMNEHGRIGATDAGDLSADLAQRGGGADHLAPAELGAHFFLKRAEAGASALDLGDRRLHAGQLVFEPDTRRHVHRENPGAHAVRLVGGGLDAEIEGLGLVDGLGSRSRIFRIGLARTGKLWRKTCASDLAGADTGERTADTASRKRAAPQSSQAPPGTHTDPEAAEAFARGGEDVKDAAANNTPTSKGRAKFELFSREADAMAERDANDAEHVDAKEGNPGAAEGGAGVHVEHRSTIRGDGVQDSQNSEISHKYRLLLNPAVIIVICRI